MQKSINAPRKADQLLDASLELLHPNAREELESNLASVRKWLVVRLLGLFRRSGDFDASMVFSPMNDQGYGFQALSIQPKGPRTDLLFQSEREQQSLNIAIVASGMLNVNVRVGEVEFAADIGRGEVIHNLTDHHLLMRPVERGSDKTFGRTSDQFPSGSKFYAHGSQIALRVVMETVHDVKKEVHGVLNHGVYACEFVY